MPYDITLGGQKFAVDNPNILLGLVDNLMKMKMAQEQQARAGSEKNTLLDTLSKYNLNPQSEAPSNFEDFGRRYQGTTGEYDAQGHPIMKFADQNRPQVTNLRQLVDIVQGLKGLPPEYSGAIISKLTGIADPSQVQAQEIAKLRSSLQAPQQQQALEQKKEAQQKLEDYRQEQINLKKQQQQNQVRQWIDAYNKLAESSSDPQVKKIAKERLNQLLMIQQSLGITSQSEPVISNFRKTK